MEQIQFGWTPPSTFQKVKGPVINLSAPQSDGDSLGYKAI